MELGRALVLVGGSYLCYLLLWRRLRVLVGRRRGPNLEALAAFDLDALEREAPQVLAALPEGGEALVHEVQVELRRAHATSGPKREAAFRAAEKALKELGDKPLASPAWTSLGPHLMVSRLSLAWLEWEEIVARRALRKALITHPAAPSVHLVGAHLEASLGHPEASIDYLARALYYANGDPFYAKPILASPYITRRRPALELRARQGLKKRDAGEERGGEGGQGANGVRASFTDRGGLGIDDADPIEEDSPSTKDGP